MQTRVAPLILATVGLGACAAIEPPPPDLGYLPPAAPPIAAPTALVGQSPALVWGNLLDRLQQSGLEVRAADQDEGYIVAVYQGDPQPYVNCGWIVTYRPGSLEQTPAAVEQVSVARRVDDRRLELQRDLRLDGRLVVRIRPQAGGAAVSTGTTYVLTKTVAPENGRPGDGLRETISFETGGRGSFTKGTECQPTGELEEFVLDSLPQTSILRSAGLEPDVPTRRDAGREAPAAERETRPVPAAGANATVAGITTAPLPPPEMAPAPRREPEPEPAPTPEPAPVETDLDQAAIATTLDSLLAGMSCAEVEADYRGNSVHLSGHVGTIEDELELRHGLGAMVGPGRLGLDLAVLPWPFCDLVERLAAHAGGLELSLPDAPDRELREGQPLTVEVVVPDDVRYLYLGYIQSDGTVAHIGTLPSEDWAGSGGRIRYRTGAEVAPPFGHEMILAVASEAPLFSEPRPAYEPAHLYMEALEARLESAASRGPLAASSLIIRTYPRADASS